VPLLAVLSLFLHGRHLLGVVLLLGLLLGRLSRLSGLGDLLARPLGIIPGCRRGLLRAVRRRGLRGTGRGRLILARLSLLAAAWCRLVALARSPVLIGIVIHVAPFSR